MCKDIRYFWTSTLSENINARGRASVLKNRKKIKTFQTQVFFKRLASHATGAPAAPSMPPKSRATPTMSRECRVASCGTAACTDDALARTDDGPAGETWRGGGARRSRERKRCEKLDIIDIKASASAGVILSEDDFLTASACEMLASL